MAACRGGHAVHLSDDRLRDTLYFRHQVRANIEDLTVTIPISPQHFRKIVAGTEGRAFPGQNNDRDLFVGTDIPQRPGQILHQLQRQRVAARGTVEGESC